MASVNTEILCLLGATLQHDVPQFRNMTTTQIFLGNASLNLLNRILRSSSNSSTGRNISDLALIKSLYAQTFDNSLNLTQHAILVRDLEHGRRVFTLPLFCLAPPLLLIIVSLRFWSRVLVMKRILVADWILFLAAITTSAMSSLLITGAINGGGLHVWDIPFRGVRLNYMISHIGQLIYLPNTSLVKISLLLFYREFSRERWYRICIYCFCGVIAVATAGGIAGGFLSCGPGTQMTKLVDPYFGDCSRDIRLLRMGLGFSALADVGILMLPIIVVARWKMHIRQRIEVICLLLLGGFGICCAVALQFTLRPYLSSNDRTWHQTPVGIWSLLEAMIGITCASLPSIRVLIVHYFGKDASNKGKPSGVTGSGSNVSQQALTAHTGTMASIDKVESKVCFFKKSSSNKMGAGNPERNAQQDTISSSYPNQSIV